jgi:outer membrane protein insertion porin family
MAPRAQNPPAEQKPPSSSGAPSSAQKTPAQSSQAPPAAPEQKLQLETPKEAPAPQKAPELTTPTAPPQPQGQPAAQQTIQDIVFRGNRRITTAVMRARIFSHKGDVYNETALRRDFMALWNTGYFDDIRLEVTDSEKGGKIVTFFVREKKLVRSIEYKGLSSVQQSDVLDEFKKRKVGLSIQSQ